MALSTDHSKLYWVDGWTRSLSALDIHSLKLTHYTAPSLWTNVLYGLAVSEGTALITEWGSTAVYQVDLASGDVHTVHSGLGTDVLFSVTLATSTPQTVFIHPCSTALCSHLCLVTGQNSYSCACPDQGGLLLDETLTTCQEPMNVIVFAGMQSKEVFITSSVYNQGNNIATVSRSPRPVAVAYDPIEQEVYWSDVQERRIYRVHISGSGQEEVLNITQGIGYVEGLAFDYNHRLLYFTNSDFVTIDSVAYAWHKIEVLDLVTGHRRVLMSDLQQPRGLYLDHQQKVLYYTDWGTDPKVGRCSLDGTNCQIIMSQTDGLLTPNGVVTLHGMVYIIDSKYNATSPSSSEGTLYAVNATLGSVKTITGISLQIPFAITTDDQHLIISDWGLSSILSYDPDSGGVSVIRSNVSYPTGLTYSNTSATLSGLTLCNSSCDEVCLPDSSNMFTCACDSYTPVWYNSNRPCTVSESFLVAADLNTVRYVSIGTESSQEFELVDDNDFLRTITAVVLDHDRQMIYFSDTTRQTMERIDLLSHTQTIQLEASDVIDDMVMDTYQQALYFTTLYEGCIKRLDLATGAVDDVVCSLNQPRALLLVPEAGYLYWSELGSNGSVSRISLNNSNHEYVWTPSRATSPNALALDVINNSVLILETSHNVLIRCHVTGNSCDSFLELSPDGQYFDVAMFGEDILLSDWLRRSIDIVNTTTGHSQVFMTGFTRPARFEVIDSRTTAFSTARGLLTSPPTGKQSTPISSGVYYTTPASNTVSEAYTQIATSMTNTSEEMTRAEMREVTSRLMTSEITTITMEGTNENSVTSSITSGTATEHVVNATFSTLNVTSTPELTTEILPMISHIRNEQSTSVPEFTTENTTNMTSQLANTLPQSVTLNFTSTVVPETTGQNGTSTVTEEINGNSTSALVLAGQTVSMASSVKVEGPTNNLTSTTMTPELSTQQLTMVPGLSTGTLPSTSSNVLGQTSEPLTTTLIPIVSTQNLPTSVVPVVPVTTAATTATTTATETITEAVTVASSTATKTPIIIAETTSIFSPSTSGATVTTVTPSVNANLTANTNGAAGTVLLTTVTTVYSNLTSATTRAAQTTAPTTSSVTNTTPLYTTVAYTSPQNTTFQIASNPGATVTTGAGTSTTTLHKEAMTSYAKSSVTTSPASVHTSTGITTVVTVSSQTYTTGVPAASGPIFIYCPDNIVVYLSNSVSRQLFWKEPFAIDNSAVSVRRLAQQSSGDSFVAGVSTISYSAVNVHSQKVAYCNFTINVTSQASLCDPVPVIINGNLDCSQPSLLLTCTVRCSAGYIINPSYPSPSYTCRTSGWDPGYPTGTPSSLCVRDISNTRQYNILVKYPVHCNHNVSESEQKQFMLSVSTALTRGGLCAYRYAYQGCNQDLYTVQCVDGANRKRRQAGGPVVQVTAPVWVTDQQFTDDVESIIQNIEASQVISATVNGNVLNASSLTVVKGELSSCPPNGDQIQQYCTACPVGGYYRSSDQSCQICPNGFYQEEEGQSSCVPCPNGHPSNPGSYLQEQCGQVVITSPVPPVHKASSGSGSNNVGPIVGGVLGGAAFLVLLGLAVYTCVKLRRHKKRTFYLNQDKKSHSYYEMEDSPNKETTGRRVTFNIGSKKNVQLQKKEKRKSHKGGGKGSNVPRYHSEAGKNGQGAYGGGFATGDEITVIE